MQLNIVWGGNFCLTGSRHYGSSFTLNEKQLNLKKTAREFAESELSPVAAKHDELEM